MRPDSAVRILYGGTTRLGNCPAYCWKHHKHMTANQMRRRQCLRKQCRHIRKVESHEFWEERRRKKQRKKDGLAGKSYGFTPL